MIQHTLQNLKNDVFISVWAVCETYSILWFIVCDRMNEWENWKLSHHHQQWLTFEQKSFLVNWILKLNSQAESSTHTHLRELAVCVLWVNEDTVLLSKDWVKFFLKCNLIVSSHWIKRLNTKRMLSMQTKKLNIFYKTFNSIWIKYTVFDKNIWNMNEHEITLEICFNISVLINTSKKKIYKKSLRNREWVTVIETVNFIDDYT